MPSEEAQSESNPQHSAGNERKSKQTYLWCSIKSNVNTNKRYIIHASNERKEFIKLDLGVFLSRIS